VNWQPTLTGSSLLLRPLVEEDFDALFEAASDPLIWEQHPDRERYTLERFKIYFRSGIESKGALAVCDLKTGQIIGSSRFTDHNPEKSFVAIGYSFLKRSYWGGKFNLEMKTLMLDYAFRFVKSVYFVVGKSNFRSQQAMAKIGGIVVTEMQPSIKDEIVFKIDAPLLGRQETLRPSSI
jgi:RimJ/RimL family protein N-acetyltransferase